MSNLGETLARMTRLYGPDDKAILGLLHEAIVRFVTETHPATFTAMYRDPDLCQVIANEFIEAYYEDPPAETETNG